MNKILKLIGTILLVSGLYNCSDVELDKNESLLPTDPEAENDDRVDNDMWAWVGTFPGDVAPLRKRLDDVSVVVKGYAEQPIFNVGSEPKYWQSTGLYVVPVEPVEIIVPDVQEGTLHYQIGVADIELTGIETGIKRFGNVTQKGKLTKGSNILKHNFGGHLYIYYVGVPSKTDVTLTVSGAVKSIDYIIDETNLEEWTVAVKDTVNPMIWGELIGKNIAITLPIEELRKIPNPGTVLLNSDKLVGDLSKLWRGNFTPIDGVQLWRIYADMQLPSKVSTFSGYPVGLDVEKENIIKALAGVGVESDRKHIYNAIGKNYLTPWYKSNLLSPVIPLLSTFYIYNQNSVWPSDFDVATLTNNPNIGINGYINLEEGVKLRMLIQLAQEYGWGLFTYVNNALISEFATTVKVGVKPIPDQIKNDCFAIAVSEYASTDLAEFFDSWNFTVTNFSRDYMEKYSAPTSKFWTEFTLGVPVVDKGLVAKKFVRPNPSLVRDSVYSPKEWICDGSSFNAGTKYENLLDGNVASVWHNDWQGGTGNFFPHDVFFNFNAEKTHELEFNYITINQKNGQNRDEVETKEFQVAIWKEGDWELVDNGRVMFASKNDGVQQFYLKDIYKTTAVKFIMLNTHKTADGTRGEENDCNLAEFRIGLIK